MLELRYRPRELGLALAGCALLALAAGLVASGLYRRQRGGGPD